MPQVLMIVGSLRRGSFNRQLAHEARRFLGEGVEASILEFASLPSFNQDVEFPPPSEVVRVREKVSAADALWFFSPEYNQQIPGVLKNLLDWLSRPYVENDWSSGTAVAGRLATISAATGRGDVTGVRAILAQLLEYMQMELVGGTGTGVALAPASFEAGRLVLMAGERQSLERQADALLARL